MPRCAASLHSRDRLALTGALVVEIRSARTGRLLRRLRQHNVVTNGGRQATRDAWDATITPPTPPTHLAFGTDATAAAATQTALVAEVFRSLLASRARTAQQIVFKHFLSDVQANGNTLREFGLFNAASGPLMFTRAVLASAIVKTSSITVTSTWTVTVSQ